MKPLPVVHCTIEAACPMKHFCQKKYMPAWESHCFRAQQMKADVDDERLDEELLLFRQQHAAAAGLPAPPVDPLEGRALETGDPVPPDFVERWRQLTGTEIAQDARVQQFTDSAGLTIKYVRLPNGRRHVLERNGCAT